MNKKLLLTFILTTILVIASATSVQAMTIVLDPGHGGKDNGASSENIIEKEINLKIGLYLRDYLNKYKDVNVVMTRSNDTYIDIYRRAIIARDNKADLLVSLHNNDAVDTSNGGVEVWVTREDCLPKYQQNTYSLAQKVIKNITALGIENRGVKISPPRSDETDIYSTGKIADYYGIICYAMRGTKIDDGRIYIVDKNGTEHDVEASASANLQNGEGIPTILIEHAFVQKDSKYLDSDEDLKKLAEADGKAIVEQYNLKLKNKQETPNIYVDNNRETQYIYADDNIETPVINLDENKYISKINAIAFELQSKEDVLTAKDLKIAHPEFNITQEQEKIQLGTGTTIEFNNITYTIVLFGDATGDGKISISDATRIIGSIVDSNNKLEGIYYFASEVTGEGKISISDATKLIGLLTGKIKYSELISLT